MADAPTPAPPPAPIINNYNYDVTCGASKLAGSVENIRSATNQILAKLTSIEELCIQMRDAMENMMELQEHIHYSHWHGTTHYAEDGVNVEDGAIFFPILPDEASILVAEYQNGFDKDQNGLIYGKHFVISDDDPEKPMSLRALDEFMLHNGDPIPSTKMGWKDYVNTVYGA